MVSKADLIIKCKYLLTMTSPLVITDAAVAVRNGKVVAAGKAGDVLSRFRAEEVVERGKHLVMPGFLDGHTHTQQVLLRSSISDWMLQLPPIWTKYLIPFELRLGEDLAYLSSLLTAASLLKNGVTYFVEACAPYPEALVKAVNEVGGKAVVTYSTYDLMDGESLNTSEVLGRVESLVSRRVEGRVRYWCSIREVMMASKDLLEGIRDLCRRYGVGLTYHLGEYQGEVDYTLSKYGMRPLEVLDSLGLTSVKPSIIAHALYFSGKEVEMVRRRGLCVCWCPTVDSALMGPHWLGFRGGPIKFCLGSDGGAFTSLDLLHEVKVARAVSKALSTSLMYDRVGLDAYTLLKALTGWGGKAVGEKVGVIGKGYSADLVVVDLRRLNVAPTLNPIEAVVGFAEGGLVSDVLVDGEFVVRDGSLTRVDEGRLIEEVVKALPRVESIINELREELRSSWVKLK